MDTYPYIPAHKVKDEQHLGSYSNGGIVMIVSVPKTVRRLYFMIMLIALSYLLYSAMSWFGDWISQIGRAHV